MRTLYTLVIIYLAGLLRPVLANDIRPLQVTDAIYIAKSNKGASKNDKLVRDGSDFESRSKSVYISVMGGYLYSGSEDISFKDSKDCRGLMAYNFICKNKENLPFAGLFSNEYFVSANFGINSDSFLRLELSYYKLLSPIELEMSNMLGLDKKSYISQIDVDGASVNLFIDLVSSRAMPFFAFTPYIMGGVGISKVELGDISFSGIDNKDYVVVGNKRDLKTFIYGAGITAGLNHYISFDIGYRFYDFGKVSTSDRLIVTDKTLIIPVKDERFMDKLEADFEAHVITVGIKIQV